MVSDQKSEKKFEEQAQRILKYLKNEIRYDTKIIPRPFFIEFTGSPSAGKTTTITELYKFLRRQGFRVLRPQEGAEVIQHISRKTPVYNVRTGIYALTMLLDESQGHLYDIVLFDRGIFDAYAWIMYWREKNMISEKEERLFQSFFLSRLWSDYIDAAFIMVCDAKIAMERELKIALSHKLGETTNPQNIEILLNRYRTAYRKLKKTHNQVNLIDTSNLTEQDMVSIVAKKTLAILERKTKSGPR
ncbi:AAA family ATPase [Candidatus Jorgensenbacteria bacterium]|nr:AAA family ATPase [Candidatus Jorgensenbacteria bacterium]